MFNSKRIKRLARPARGQSLVEFSLTAIILIIIVSGLLDLGRLYFMYVALEDAVGEAALYLALNPECPDEDISKPACNDPNNAIYRAETAGGEALNWSSATIETQVIANAAGLPVSVTIRYPYTFLTPVVSQIASQVNLTVTATQTILSDP